MFNKNKINKQWTILQRRYLLYNKYFSLHDFCITVAFIWGYSPIQCYWIWSLYNQIFYIQLFYCKHYYSTGLVNMWQTKVFHATVHQSWFLQIYWTNPCFRLQMLSVIAWHFLSFQAYLISSNTCFFALKNARNAKKEKVRNERDDLILAMKVLSFVSSIYVIIIWHAKDDSAL